MIWGDVAFYVAVLAAAVILRPHTVTWVAALIAAAVTFPLWIAARVQLGSAVSFRPRATRLVTTGLYSRIRHPVYLFGSMASLSALAALQVWPMLALGVAAVPFTIYRAYLEQQVLETAFGERYKEYRDKTWF